MKFVIERFNRRDVVFLLVALALVLFYVAKANGGFPLDDSWIHQVYGRNLAQTGQWAFVVGTPSAASTSPLYTVLLSIGYRLNIPFKLWTHTLGVLALWITGMISARMAERLLPAQKWAGWVAGLLLLLEWHLIWAAASGMETMLFSMWTLVLIHLAWREADAQQAETALKKRLWNGAIFGAFAALATLTRPEGVVLTAVIGLVMIIARPQGAWRSFLVWAIAAAVAFLILMTPYLALNIQLTGGLLPDTAAAKQAESAGLFAESFLTRLINMVVPIFAGAQVILVPGILYFAVYTARDSVAQRKRLFDLLPLFWALILILLYTTRLPANYQHGRYVIPVLPSLVLLGTVGTLTLVRISQRSLLGRVLTRSLAISSILGFVGFAFTIGPSQYAQDVTIIDQEMVASAHWIADHIPPDQILAVHDIGAVGYFAPRPILDLAGLVSPEIVPFIKDADQLWIWLYKRGARYMMGFPDQIPGQNTHDPRLCPVFTTGGEASITAGGDNMTVYEIVWDEICPKD